MERSMEELATTEFPDIPSEFQRRREITRRLETPWICLMIAGWLGAFVAFFAERLSPMMTGGLMLVSLVMLGVSIVRMNFIAMKHYRCPVCDQMPVVGGMRGGMLLNPEECPSCGVSFKYYNRF